MPTIEFDPDDNGGLIKVGDAIREHGRDEGAASRDEEVAAAKAALAAEKARADAAEKALADHMATHEPTDPEPRVCPAGTDRAGQTIPDGETEAWCTVEEPEPTDFGRRFYITQQVSTASELRNYADEFADAQRTIPATNGLSIRFPWKAYEADKSIATLGLGMTDLPHYALRSMAGKHTPTSKMGRTLTESGTTYPSPFGDTAGNPNTVFLDHLEAHYRELAEILADTDETDPILQWTWYAKEWAEIYHGPAVRSAPGYTVDKFIGAHKALIDRAARVQADYPGIVMGLQLSGHGPIAEISGGRVLVAELVKHATSIFEPGRAIIHANGWSYRGQWGQANPDVDEAMDAAFEAAEAGGLHVGMQAIQPFGQNQAQYTATQVAQAFGQAEAVGTSSIELYTPSFLSRNGGQVWATPTGNWINEEN